MSCAKTMAKQSTFTPLARPHFEAEARRFVEELVRFDLSEIVEQLDCTEKLALETSTRFKEWLHFDNGIPAVMAYNGVAFKSLDAKTLSPQTLQWAQEHLLVTSFLYGLVRAMDAIRPYRMLGSVRLEATDGDTVFAFWRSRLTDWLIDKVKQDDGVLVHLATEEMERLFDWRAVTESVEVIKPYFKVLRKDGKLVTQAVYAKRGRGAMVRHLLEQRASTPQAMQSFEAEGFHWEGDWLFVRWRESNFLE